MLPFKTDDRELRWHVTRKGIRIAWYLQGRGEPLVLIRGYSNAGSMWYSQVPTLSRAFRVITFDNRDTGNSDRVAEPYTISEVLKKWIPQARLIIYEGLGHLFLMEDPNTANADVQRFIQASSANHP